MKRELIVKTNGGKVKIYRISKCGRSNNKEKKGM